MKEPFPQVRFWLAVAVLLPVLLPSSAAAAQQKERWEESLEKARKLESEGQLDEAVPKYMAALKDLRKASQRAREDQNAQTATEAEKAEAKKRLSEYLLKTAAVDLTLARLGLLSMSLYGEAIRSAEGDASLRFRACNDYGVFLLREKGPADALTVFDNVKKGLKEADRDPEPLSDDALFPVNPEASDVPGTAAPCERLPGLLEPDSRVLSAYLYNYGRALEQSGKPAEALSHYRDSFLRDPTFRPAEDAAVRLAQEAEPGQGIEVLQRMAERSLEELSFTRAERHLETVIRKAEWAKHEKLADMLMTLLRLFTLESLEPPGFEATWKTSLEDLRSRSTKDAAARIESILNFYAGSFEPCVSTDDLWRSSRIWKLLEASTLSDFLKMLADQRAIRGEDAAALNAYLWAACFNPRNQENSFYLANFLVVSSEQRDRLEQLTKKFSSDFLYGPLGAAYADLGEKDLAVEAFRRAAQLSGDPLKIAEYWKYTMKLASPEQFAMLKGEYERLRMRAQEAEDEITVAGQGSAFPRTQYAYAKFVGVPVMNALAVRCLVEPTWYGPHLSTADSEGGQKDAVAFAGTSSANSSVAVDQVVITGLVEPEMAPVYYAIDALESIEVIASGSDMTRSSSGPSVNLVTKTPGGRWKGSGSYQFLPESVNETLGRQENEFAPAQKPVVTNRIRDNRETGVQAGGDFKRDRLFAWVSYNESDLSVSAFGGDRFENHLETTAFKVLSALSEKDSITLSASLGEGRNQGLGAGLTRSRGTTLDQDSDSKILKAEYTRRIKQWDLMGYHSRIRSDLSFSPLSTDGDVVLGPSGVWRGTFRSGMFESEADQTELRLNHFLGSERGRRFQNAFSLGGRLQNTKSIFESRFGRSNSVFIAEENLDTGFDVARFYRSGRVRTEENAEALWVQDTLGYRGLTLDLGLRYDRQRGENRGASAAANPIVPDLLPAVETGGGEVIDWESLTPRVGAAYKLGEPGREMILRASYARFVSMLQTRYVQRTNAAFPAYAQLGFDDLDGDDVLDPGESRSLRFLAPFGYDPLRAGAGSANAISPDLEPEITNEGILGVERKLAGDVELELAATYRRVSKVLELRDFVREGTGAPRLANRSDYVFNRFETVELPDGSRSTVSTYTLRPGVAFAGGSLLANGDRTQEYLGLRLNVRRPLGERGSLRGVFAWEDSWWRIGPEFRAFDDPNDASQSLDPSGISRADDDDDIVIPQSTRFDTQGSPFSNAEWSFNLNGSFEVWKGSGVMVGTNVTYHDGFPLPYFATVLPPDGLEREIQVVSKSDSFRLPDFLVIDLRVQKTFRFREAEATLSLDGFNVLNEGTALQRIRQLNGPQPDFLAKTLNPRTIRLGLQLAFGNTD